ncbi:MAG: hypothetical protein QM831_08175 [Kofleriaceae bacterium]
MRLALVLLLCAACSGDDSHRRVSQPKSGLVPIVKSDAGTAPSGPGELNETMAVSYWTTPDEKAGLAAFTAKNWTDAVASFGKARAAVKADDPKAPRLELMLGLATAELNDNTTAAQHLTVAYKALPELSDYIGYHLAKSLWLSHDPVALDIASSVAHDSIDGPDAEILVGELTPADKKADYYKHYLDKHPNGPFRSEARYDLAQATEKSDRDGCDQAVSPDHDRRSAVELDHEGDCRDDGDGSDARSADRRRAHHARHGVVRQHAQSRVRESVRRGARRSEDLGEGQVHRRVQQGPVAVQGTRSQGRVGDVRRLGGGVSRRR